MASLPHDSTASANTTTTAWDHSQGAPATTTPTTTTGASTMGSPAGGSHNAGAKTGNVIKQGIARIHGAGEALRGNINTFADSLAGSSAKKSEAEVKRGMSEIETGHLDRPRAELGVTPADTAAERRI